MLNRLRAPAWRCLFVLAAAFPLAAVAAPQVVLPFQGATSKTLKAKPFRSEGSRVQFNVGELRNLLPGQEMELTLPDGSKHAIVLDLVQDKGEGITSWVGHYKDATQTLRTIITSGPGGTFGTIATPDNEYSIVPGPGDGSDWLVDMKAEKPFLPPIDLHHDAHSPKRPKSSVAPQGHEPEAVDLIPGVNSPAVAKSAAAVSTPSPGVVVDILMAYTSGYASSLVSYTGNANAVQTRLQQLITSANTIFADSGVAVTMRMVGSVQVTYSDTAKDTLGALADVTPGVNLDSTDPEYDSYGVAPGLTGIEALRTQYGADMVTLLRDGYTNGGDGVAWVPQGPVDATWAPYMYSAMTGCTMSCDWVWVHEIGHNFGSAHDRGTNAWENGGTNIPGSFSYSYGYYACQGGRFALSCAAFSGACTQAPECSTASSGTNNYSDIMAYFQGSAVKNMVFSNPALTTCKGSAGTASTCGSAVGNVDEANAALTLNNNRVAMSQIKPTVVPLTIASTTALVSSVNPSVQGQSVTFTATVAGTSGTPTGNVAFKVNGSAISGCSAVALSGAGQAACTTSGLAAGTGAITAAYAGNTTYSASVSATLAQVVNAKATPVVAVTTSANFVTAGTSVTIRATLSGSSGTPTGTVTFTDGTTTLCSSVALSAGVASCIAPSLSAGDHSIAAAYSGSATYNTGSSGIVETILLAPPPGTTNVALAANGGVASASSQLNADFPVSAINNGERAGINWTHGGGWADGTLNQWPDWVQIDFGGPKLVSQVVVYTLQDNWQSPGTPTDTMTFTQQGVTDFTVQGWDGVQWVALAAVSDNRLVKRTVNFPAFNTTKIRILVTASLYYVARITEVEAWGAAGTVSSAETQSNVALAANGGIASASSQLSTDFPISAINNGERAGVNWTHGGGWADGTISQWPDYVQVDFNGPKTIDHVVLYTLQDNYASPVEPGDTMTFTQQGVTAFDVQAWNGTQWVTLGSVSGNNLVKRTLSFGAVTTTKIRVNVTAALYYVSRITEVEAWGVPAGPPRVNVALASNGGVASASSQLNSDFPVAAVNNGDRTGVNWTHGGGWADGTLSQWPDWVQIDFNGSKTIDQVVVYTLQDNYQSPVEPQDSLAFTQQGVTAFDVQGWNGSQWVTLASVTGNNLVKRSVSFSAFTTTKIRINVTAAMYYVSRITEIEAWGN